jgi:hypothetical protein
LNTTLALKHFLTNTGGEDLAIGSDIELSTGVDHYYEEETKKWLRRPEIKLTVWASNILKREERSYEEWTTVLNSYRKLKRLTGPWKAKSEPPFVYLGGDLVVNTGTDSIPSYKISVVVYGTHECILVNEKEVCLTDQEHKSNLQRAAALEREADALRTAAFRIENEWSCEAALPEDF